MIKKKNETRMQWLRGGGVALLVFMFALPGSLFSYSFHLEFNSDGYHFNNADFINYDKKRYEENQPVDRQNSDDAISFVYSGISLGFMQRYKFSEFFVTIRQSGMWGSDSLEGRPVENNTITYSELYFNYYFTQDLMMSLGRYRYSLEDATQEYFFNDTIDGISLKHELPWGMQYRILLDVLGIASKPEDTRVWFSLAKDKEQIDDFQGDTATLRAGLIFDHEAFKIADEYLQYKLFSFYLRYGANTSGGADIAENGRSALNEADNDYLSNSGVRFSYEISRIWATDLTVAYSIGVDNQFNDKREYKDLAAAMNHRLESSRLNWPVDVMLDLSLGYFGPKYASMKANSPGGTLVTAYKGYFPSPYAYFYEIRDEAKSEYEVGSVDKTVSKSFGRAEISAYLGGFLASVSGLVLFANERDNDGKTQFGETNAFMGTEVEASLRYNLDNISFELLGGVFLPGDYFEKRSKENVYLPLGKDPMYGAGLSVVYALDF